MAGDFCLAAILRFAEAPRDSEAVERLDKSIGDLPDRSCRPRRDSLVIAAAPAIRQPGDGGRDGRALLAGLTRDVAFREYPGQPLTKAAICDLRAIGFGELTPATLFRGETEEDCRGPFVSQFLLRNIPYELKTVDQRFRAQVEVKAS